MSEHRTIRTGRNRQAKTIHLAPMPRAVRSILAASALTVVLTAAGPALATPASAATASVLQRGLAQTAQAPVIDLTTVQPSLVITAPAIDVTDPGDIEIDNHDAISEYGPYSASAIRAYSGDGMVGITNHEGADLLAVSYGTAIGIYGYSGTGDVWIDNAAGITAVSLTDIADGIFASGANVAVANGGELQVGGDGWAAGIEAHGADSVIVSNTADITAYARAFTQELDEYADLVAEDAGGTATGIFARGGDGGAVVVSSGAITVDAGYATGISAEASGDVLVVSTGDIVAGSGQAYSYTYSGGIYYFGSVLADGIHASSNGEGARVVVQNGGSIRADGTYGATGITAISSGSGGSAGVVNNGDIEVFQQTKYGTGAYGVVVSADGDADIDNAGSVQVLSRGQATGLAALSFAGHASVANSGEVVVGSTALMEMAATGISVFGANGTASVDNSGSVYVVASNEATGIDARAFGDVHVANSGDVYANGDKYAFGVYATSGTGNAIVDNAEGAGIGFYSYGGRGFGVLAVASQGDVLVDNAGSIEGYAFGQSVGVFALADQGSVGVDNSGSISVLSGNNPALGVFARADAGLAAVSNSGDISARSGTGAYPGSVAYGVLARGTYALVENSGTVYAYGYDAASAISAWGDAGAVVESTGGTIDVFATGAATGIHAESQLGGSHVGNASDITAIGLALGADGIRATSVEGDASVTNSGAITALSILGEVNGIVAYSILGDARIDNSGDIDVADTDGDGHAIGLYAYSAYADSTVVNSGAVQAYSYDGLADAIFASGNHVVVSNSGALDASGYAWAAGIEARATTDAVVGNSGAISAGAMPFVQIEDAGGVVASSVGGQAFGIYASADEGQVRINNTGAIEATAGYATGIAAQAYGDALVWNSGDIAVGSGLASDDLGGGYTLYYGTLEATGISATSTGEGGLAQVKNTGDITVDTIFGGSGIVATAAGLGGSALVDTDGALTVYQSQKYGSGAYGVVASGDADATVIQRGQLDIQSEGGATGVMALAFAGNALVVNNGDISVNSGALLDYEANGIVAFSANGDTAVGNYGSVDASGGAYTRGVDARGLGDVTVVNGGSIYADGKYAFGVYAQSGSGDTVVSNRADGDIGFYSFGGTGFGVFGISSAGDVLVDNAGSISGYAYGQSVGVFTVASSGDASVVNSGSLDIASGDSIAVGAFARADNGTGTVINRGDVVATSGGDYSYGQAAYGLFARGDKAQAGNSGSIRADGFLYATGILATSRAGSTVSASAGSITASAMGTAYGIDASSVSGNVVVSHGGTITATGTVYAGIGIQAESGSGNVSVGNSGKITASTSDGDAIGILAIGEEQLLVANASGGTITAKGGANAIGIRTQSVYGDVVINNAGTIQASGAALNAAVQMQGYYGSNTLNNLAGGVLSASGADGAAFAVLGGDADDTINNSGRLLGAVSLYGGDDALNNKSGGVWDVGATTHTDFGDGDDTISNAAGGLITVAAGRIAMGSGDDSLVNAGIVRLSGGGLVSFDDGDDLISNVGGGMFELAGGNVRMGAGANAFNNAGTIKVTGTGNLIDVGSGGTLSNTGLVNFLNGSTADRLTVAGTLAGTGSMNIDVNLANGSADQLLVQGNVAAGTVQTVNVGFTGMPTTAHTSVAFANVTGTSAAGNFAPGQFIGYNAGPNFLMLGLTIGSNINAANTANDVFSVDIDVNGLNDAGTLAASAASGAAGFMGTQVGTFRQRMGVNPYGDQDKVLSAFVRGYTSEGSMRPGHVAANFGQGGHFNYDQSTWGREVGINAHLLQNFHAGLVLGNADSRMRLADGGVGEMRMDGMTVGGYATWYVPDGFYVDLSARKMAADIRTTSVGGPMQSRGHASAWNLEAGYTWSVGGLNLVPQAQYTRTRVENIRTFFGDRIDFIAEGGTFTRGRLGLEVNKTIASGDMRWTPYGSINAVRDFDGASSYRVGAFNGGTDLKGSGAMAELGLGMQAGGLGANVGLSWADGGAYKSVFGAQASLRYSW